MRARDFAFWLAFILAGPSFAQNAAYSKFPTATADTCATACTSDRMCASWSFGGATSVGEATGRSKKNAGPPPQMCALSTSLVPVSQAGFESGLPRRTGILTPTGRYADGPANYEVRPAPWLDPRARAPQPVPSYNQGAPIAPPPTMTAAPPTPPSAGRVEFVPAQPAVAAAAPSEMSAPRTGARGMPRQQETENVARPVPPSYFGSRPTNIAQPNPPLVAAVPSPSPMNEGSTPAAASPAPQQQMQSQAAPQQASDLSKFRGADGMVDAAAMRRAQINSARATGQPAYAVQREWEAVEQERQRAASNGEVRADPLAGTVPVPEAAQPKSNKPSPRYDSDPANLLADEDPSASEVQKPTVKSKGARGTPRAEQSSSPRQSALNQAVRERARNPSYIDREPRLSGGPGG